MKENWNISRVLFTGICSWFIAIYLFSAIHNLHYNTYDNRHNISNTGLNQVIDDKRFFIDKNGNTIPVFDENTLYPKPGGEASNPETEYSTFNEWNSAIKRRFYQRNTILQENCEKHRNIVIGNKAELPIEMSLGKSLLTCLISKVGTTTWKTYMARLMGINPKKFKNLNLMHDAGKWVHNVLKKSLNAREQYSEEELLSILSNKTSPLIYNGKSLHRIIIVRPPLERLVSTYKMYSEGYITESEKGRLKKVGHKIENAVNKAEKIKPWISKIINQNNNQHWTPYDTLCSPCFFKYDYILHLDTLEEDMAYIYEKAGLQDEEHEFNIKFHMTYKKNDTNIDQYFSSLPQQLLKSIYSKYRQDFYLFGYELPYYLKQFD